MMNNRKKNNISNKEALIIGAVLFGLIFIGYYLSRSTEDELNKFGKETKGIVVDIDHQISRGSYLTYEFEVSKKKYNRRQNMKYKKHIGDTIKILYSTKNPNKSKIIW